jgi:hypothetical protein
MQKAVQHLARALLIGRLGVLDDRRLDRALTTAVVAAVAISRWLAFPASIWDIDEAIFATALVELDLTRAYPHPPFFPLWMVLGSACRTLLPHLEPATALQLVSAVASVWMVFPLTALWSLVLSRRQALTGALLFALSPLPWLLAGRAYTGTAATALLVAAAAVWLRPRLGTAGVAVGGVYLTACLLIRPQWLPIGLALAAWRAWHGHDRLARALPFVVPLLLGLPAVLAVVAVAGGVDELLQIVGRHGRYHFGALAGYGTAWQRLGIIQAWGGVVPGSVWSLVALHGAVMLWLERRSAALTGVLAALLLPVLLVVTGSGNPTSLRYTLPFLALTSGLVVASVASMPRSPVVRTSVLAALMAGLISTTAVRLGEYRGQASPVIRALDRVADDRLDLLADRSITAFVDLYAATRGYHPTVTWGRALDRRTTVPAQPGTAILYDPERTRWQVTGVRERRFTCDDPLLRHFASPRLLDLVVVYGNGGVGVVGERSMTRTSAGAAAPP